MEDSSTITLLGVLVGQPKIFKIKVQADQYVDSIKNICANELRGSDEEIKIYFKGKELKQGRISELELYNDTRVNIRIIERQKKEEEKEEEPEAFNFQEMEDILNHNEIQEVLKSELKTTETVGLQDLLTIQKDKGAPDRIIKTLRNKNPELLREMVTRIENSPLALFAGKYISMINTVLNDPEDPTPEIPLDAIDKLREIGIENNEDVLRLLQANNMDIERTLNHFFNTD